VSKEDEMQYLIVIKTGKSGNISMFSGTHEQAKKKAFKIAEKKYPNADTISIELREVHI